MILPSLEIKAGFAGRLGKGCNLALINITASVEDDFRDSFLSCSLADHFADLLGCSDIIGILESVLDLLFNGAGGYQSLLCIIIDDLSIDVLIASIASQTRSLRRAAETVADPDVLFLANGLSVVLLNRCYPPKSMLFISCLSYRPCV